MTSSGDPIVYECCTCGRLWVGLPRIYDGPGYVQMPGHFTVDDMTEIMNRQHAPPGPHPPGGACFGDVWMVHKAAVIAAFWIGGRAAAEAMIDHSLRKHIEEHEQRK